MNIILLPAWVEKAIKTADLPLKDARDLKVMKTILSDDDLAFYISLNQYLFRWIPTEIIESIDNIKDAFENWDLVVDERIATLAAEHQMRFMSDDKVDKKSTSELFGPLEDTSDGYVTFNLISLNPDVMALRPTLEKLSDDVPVNIEATYKKIGLDLADKILYHLNERLTFDKVAQLPIFKYFFKHSIV